MSQPKCARERETKKKINELKHFVGVTLDFFFFFLDILTIIKTFLTQLYASPSNSTRRASEIKKKMMMMPLLMVKRALGEVVKRFIQFFFSVRREDMLT